MNHWITKVNDISSSHWKQCPEAKQPKARTFENSPFLLLHTSSITAPENQWRLDTQTIEVSKWKLSVLCLPNSLHSLGIDCNCCTDPYCIHFQQRCLYRYREYANNHAGIFIHSPKLAKIHHTGYDYQFPVYSGRGCWQWSLFNFETRAWRILHKADRAMVRKYHRSQSGLYDNCNLFPAILHHLDGRLPSVHGSILLLAMWIQGSSQSHVWRHTVGQSTSIAQDCTFASFTIDRRFGWYSMGIYRSKHDMCIFNMCFVIFAFHESQRSSEIMGSVSLLILVLVTMGIIVVYSISINTWVSWS